MNEGQDHAIDHAFSVRLTAQDLRRYWLSPQQREQFEEEGVVVLPGVLEPEEVERLATISFERYRADRALRGLAPEDRYDRYDLLAVSPAFATLLDNPRTLAPVVEILGPNVYCYINHFSVLPPTIETSSLTYFKWLWHQDNQQLALDLAVPTLPRFDLKVAYFLTDLSVPGRGNTWYVPGSQRNTQEPPPPCDDGPPHLRANARPLLGNAGSAAIIDPRVWHAATPNDSDITRIVIWIGYGYRWLHSRGDRGDLTKLIESSDLVRRQLLGESTHVDWGAHPPLASLLRT